MNVSVIMPSYRHERYIAQAINSILAQTMINFELIIIDDGSPDNSNDIIRDFNDSRIIHIALPTNTGASEAMNIALRRASAPLIAICNSDDVWEPTKLSLQLTALDRYPDCAAIFSNVTWIDAQGGAISEKSPRVLAQFAQENRSRHAWLKRLVEQGNCLCHSSVLIRRTAYETCGHYDSYLRQAPDYDMWLRLVQHQDIHVLPDRLVGFRVHEANTSKPSSETMRRANRETLFIFRKLFDEISADNFSQAFLGLPPTACAREQAADQNAILTYLCSYQGPMQHIFRDMMLERIYRAPPTERLARLTILNFQNEMAKPWPAFMAETPSKPRTFPRRLKSFLSSMLRKI